MDELLHRLDHLLHHRQDLALPIFAGLFGAAVLLAFFAYIKSRRSQAARAEELKLAGFSPVELPPALAERLRRLNTGGSSLAFRNVWRMARADGELYMLDLWDTGGDSNSMTAQGLVVILSRKLALPRIHAMPRLASLGWFGRLAEPLFSRLVNWGAARQGLTRVSFPDEPHLDAAFMFLSSDADKARAFLGGTRGLWLTQLPAALQWEGEGELLCVRTWDWARQGKTVTVGQALENAGALTSLLTR